MSKEVDPDDYCPFCGVLREDCIDAQAHCTPRKNMTQERLAELRIMANQIADINGGRGPSR